MMVSDGKNEVRMEGSMEGRKDGYERMDIKGRKNG